MSFLSSDEYGLPIRRKRLRSGQKGSVLNWMEFIPPPPDHPPSERGSPTHSASNLRNPYAMRNIHSQVRHFNMSCVLIIYVCICKLFNYL